MSVHRDGQPERTLAVLDDVTIYEVLAVDRRIDDAERIGQRHLVEQSEPGKIRGLMACKNHLLRKDLAPAVTKDEE